MNRTLWLEKLRALVKAAEELNNAWPPNEDPVGGEYPPGLPSFDEHVWDLQNWLNTEPEVL